jgi:RecA-family ATPase
MYHALNEHLTEWAPSLTALDVLADMFGGDENSRVQSRQFIGLLKKLARKHDCAFLLLAHPSLTGMNTGTGTSGSTGWNNAVRSRLYLQPAKASDGSEPNKNLRTFQGMKSNYGARGGKIDLEWKNGLFVPVQGATGLGEMAAEAKADEVFLTLVKRFNGEGRNIIDTKATAYAPAIFAAQPDAQGVTNEQFRAAMNRLFKGKKVHIVDNGTKSKPSRTIVITKSLNP